MDREQMFFSCQQWPAITEFLERRYTLAGPILYFEIIGPDASALQRFYTDLFGWPLEAQQPGYGMVKTGGDGGIDGGIGTDQDGANRVTVYAEVADLQPYLDKAVQLGGRVVVPPTEAGGVTFAHFADPAGNITGIYKG